MNCSFKAIQRLGVVAALLAASALCAGAASGADDKSLAQQIFDTMQQAGAKPGYRTAHAKGIVCEGTFTPSKDAATLSKAAHFQGASVPVIVRFSSGSPDPSIADNSPDAGPQGIAIRFILPDGGKTDIVSLSHNGFAVGTGEDFLEIGRAHV
jgi:catalase